MRVVELISQTMRQGCRRLLKAPSFTIVTVLTLATALGANTAVFALIDQLLLRPLPVKEPDTLVLVSAGPLPSFQGGGTRGSTTRPDGTDVWNVDYRLFSELSRRVSAFATAFVQCSRRVPVLVGDAPGEVTTQLVSANYFAALGIRSAAGRLLAPDDDLPAAAPVIVISHGYWRRQFGGDPSAVGRTVRLSGHPVTIVGVTPGGFTGLSGAHSPDLFVPLGLYDVLRLPGPHPLATGGLSMLEMVARLRPGVTIEQAQAAGEGVYQQLFADAVGGNAQKLQESDKRLARKVSVSDFERALASRHLRLFAAGYGLSSQSLVTPQLLRALQVLGVMSIVLLFTAASSITNLQVARGETVRREVAICLALGASRARLLADRLLDNLLLALGSGAAGLVLSQWIAKVLLLILPLGSGYQPGTTAPDRRTVVFTVVLALATGVIVWLTSALQLTRRSTLPPLSDTGLGGASTRPMGFRRALLGLQTALSLGLLCVASMFAHSIFNVTHTNLGFPVGGLTTFRMEPNSSASQRQTEALVSEFAAALAGAADVRAVAATTHLPLETAGGDSVVGGDVPLHAETAVTASTATITPGYFQTIGLPLVRGREFTEFDRAGGETVAVVNEALARALFGTKNPLGEKIGLQHMALDTTVIGVVKDTRGSLRQPPQPAMFVPLVQHTASSITVVVRTKSGRPLEAAFVRSLVKRIDRTLAVTELATLEQRIGDTLSRDRVLAALSAACAGLATLLCGLGLFGMMSFHVATRQREIGIRIALWAERWSVQWSVVRDATCTIALAAPVGLMAYVASSRVIATFLFDLSPTDAPTIGAATVVLLLVAFVAAVFPARRAARLDPAVTLRRE